VADICPANASFMVRFDPDVIAPFDLEARVRAAEQEVGDAPSLTLQTRIVEVPVWYDDPFANETAARFRDRHHRKEGHDLDFAAAENGLSSVQDFIADTRVRPGSPLCSPWITSMFALDHLYGGGVRRRPSVLFQMVPRERQLQVPKLAVAFRQVASSDLSVQDLIALAVEITKRFDARGDVASPSGVGQLVG